MQDSHERGEYPGSGQCKLIRIPRSERLGHDFADHEHDDRERADREDQFPFTTFTEGDERRERCSGEQHERLADEEYAKKLFGFGEQGFGETRAAIAKPRLMSQPITIDAQEGSFGAGEKRADQHESGESNESSKWRGRNDLVQRLSPVATEDGLEHELRTEVGQPE